MGGHDDPHQARSAHTIRQSCPAARSPTSLTPIARVADGDRRSKHKGKGVVWNPLAPFPGLSPVAVGTLGYDWELEIGAGAAAVVFDDS